MSIFDVTSQELSETADKSDRQLTGQVKRDVPEMVIDVNYLELMKNGFGISELMPAIKMAFKKNPPRNLQEAEQTLIEVNGKSFRVRSLAVVRLKK